MGENAVAADPELIPPGDAACRVALRRSAPHDITVAERRAYQLQVGLVPAEPVENIRQICQNIAKYPSNLPKFQPKFSTGRESAAFCCCWCWAQAAANAWEPAAPIGRPYPFDDADAWRASVSESTCAHHG